MTSFSSEEYQRYSRHFNLPNFSREHQQRLKDTKVLVVGAGGLGSPLLLYLAAAGIGTIGIVDNDVIELSNLQRQVLYETSQIGKHKVDMASEKLSNMNPNTKVIVHPAFLTTENALDIISGYDVVADGTDNFPTRYLVNDACVILGKTNVYASIFQFEGQVSVFNLADASGDRGPNYRHLFPEPPRHGTVPDCATGGVLGVLAGIIGSMQALEVIKVASGLGSSLSGKLFIYDALTSTSRTIRFQKKNEVVISQLIDYDEFCGIHSNNNSNNKSMKEISVQELKEWRESGKDFQLVDVREQHEVDFVNIGGEHIPLGNIIADSDKINRDNDVVLLCRSGQRSGAAVGALEAQGFSNLYNLKGGITAWAREIDTSLPTY